MLQFASLRKVINTISNTIMAGIQETPEPELPLNMQFHESDRYKPSVEDVLIVKTIIHTQNTSPIPLELIDTIIDMAEYWPHNTTRLNGATSVRSGDEDENKFMLRSLPIGFPDYTNNNEEEYKSLYNWNAKYSTNPPKPWSKDREIPQDATKDVLEAWTQKSRPRGEYPCRKIVFKLKSHDQGWGGSRNDHGAYTGSFTWFDTGLERLSATRELGDLIEAQELAPTPQFRINKRDSKPHEEKRETTSSEIVCSLRTLHPNIKANPSTNPQNPLSFDHELNPSRMVLQKNKTATRESQDTEITWKYTDNIHPESREAGELESMGRGRETGTGDMVRSMKIGDTITVWAKARFPGWCNFVEGVSINVYWAV